MMAALTIAVLVGIISAIVFVIFRHYRSKNYRTLMKIPGLPTKPLLGNITDIIGMDLVDFSELVWDCCEKYGSPTKFVLGPQINVVLSDADQIEIVCKSLTNITKSNDYDLIVDWLGTGLLISTGQKWQTRRKQLTPAFHFQILRDFVPVFNEQAAVLVDILKEISVGGGSTGFDARKDGSFNICQYITNCTLDIICETAMGKQLNCQHGHSDYAESLEKFATLVMYRFKNYLLRSNFIFALTPWGWESKRHMKLMHKFTADVIAEREASKQSQSQNTEAKSVSGKRRRLAFLDMLLELKSEGQLTSEEVREEVDTFMFEGHDTTATGIMWALYCIGAHPDVQERIYEEIIENIGEDDGGYISDEMIGKLKYTEMALKESQRMFPSVPMIGRHITESFKAGEYDIPAGSVINMDIVSLHRNPKYFPDPLRYDPDRFLSEETAKRSPFAFIPFSAGARNCIGQKFALMEEKVIVAHVVRNFTFRSMQSVDEVRPKFGVVLRPNEGLWIKFTPRQ